MTNARFLRLVYWLAAIGIVVAVAAIVALNRWYGQKYEATLDAYAEDAAASVELFCQLQAKLDADPFFHEPRVRGDAGGLLNAWVAWGDADRPGRPIPALSPLIIPSHLPYDATGRRVGGVRLEVARDAEDVRAWLVDSPDVSQLDFSWMARLHNFDRWDLMGVGSPLLESKPFVWFKETTPAPYYMPLLTWAQLRLVDG